MAKRTIGIRHRVKQIAQLTQTAQPAQPAQPTQVTILMPGGKLITIELEDDDCELDFVKGSLPVKWIPINLANGMVEKIADGATTTVSAADEIDKVNPRHIKWRKVKKDENLSHLDQRLFRTRKGSKGDVIEIVSGLPCEYEGLRHGDAVAMVLGGSGDRFAFALSNRGEQVGAQVWRMPTYALKQARIAAGVREDKKDDDARILAESLRDNPGSFTLTEARDRDLILLRELWIRRIEAMKARIGCEQRLRQHFIGEVFCNPHGHYPEGSVEVEFDRVRANDTIHAALKLEEELRAKELEKIVTRLDIFLELFKPIEGVGPMISTRIIVAIGDIRRFEDRLKSRITTMGMQCREEKRLGNWDASLVQERTDALIAETGQGPNNYRLTQWMRTHYLHEVAKVADRALDDPTVENLLTAITSNISKDKAKKYSGPELREEADKVVTAAGFPKEALAFALNVIHLNRALELYEHIHVLRQIEKGPNALGFRAAGLKAFAGVHVLRGGKHGERATERQFVRRRTGDVANWHPDLRQALYLLGDQFNRRPNSPWGKKLLANKAALRAKHPDVECIKCSVPWNEESHKDHKRKYSDGHVLKQALWVTVTQFVEWLWEAWWQLELRRNPVPSGDPVSAN